MYQEPNQAGTLYLQISTEILNGPPSRVLAKSIQEDTVTKEHAKMASIKTAQRWRGKNLTSLG